jgi:PAS domain S-box-containing protein
MHNLDISVPGVAPASSVSRGRGVKPSSHSVQFYADHSFLVESLSRLVEGALKRGDVVIVIPVAAHGEGLARSLKSRNFDTAAAVQEGRYIVLDAAEMLLRIVENDMPAPARFAEVVGQLLANAEKRAGGTNAGVTVFGEMVAALCGDAKYDAALRLEQLWNELTETHSFSLRCAYPMDAFHHAKDSQLWDVCTAHCEVIPSESYTALSTESERLRNVAFLQQRAQSLDTETVDHEQTRQSLRRREAELAEVLENALEGVQQVGADQKVLWTNKAMLRLLGYAPEEYVGHNLAEFWTNPAGFANFWKRLMSKEDIYNYPAEMRCKDGSVKEVLIHSNGIWENGQFMRTRCFLRDVTAQKMAERALQESEARLRRATTELESIVEQRTQALRQLSVRVLTLRDTERRRVARELHDSLGQYFVALKLRFDMLKRNPVRNDLWEESEKLMDQCIAETRTLSYLLHPPTLEDAGLASAIRWYVDGFCKRSPIHLKLRIPDDLPRLPQAPELTLFRVLQEALTNVHRHSNALMAEVEIRQGVEQISLEIRDFGCGISPELLARFNEIGTGMGIGLTGMRERVLECGGNLVIVANSPGTTVRVVLPLKPSDVNTEPVRIIPIAS